MVRLLNNRYAAIDIGTNGVRLLLASASANNQHIDIRKDSLIRIPIRLGEDVFSSKTISKNKADDLLNALQGFHYLIRAYRPSAVRAVATSAMREATNAKGVIQSIYRATKISIEVLSGREEARTIYSAHLQQIYQGKNTYIYIDVGGGSTEIILFKETEIIDYRSFNMGTVRSLQGFDDESEFSNMKRWLLEMLPPKGKLIAVGTGGNINRTLKILGQKKQNVLNHVDIKLFYNKLKGLSPQERMLKYGLKNDRADVIVPALKIYLTIMKYLSLNTITVPSIGLVDGLIYEMANHTKI